MTWALGAAATAVVVLAGCGGSAASEFEPTSPTNAKKLMVSYLEGKHLNYRWVACLHSGRSFKGAAIVRCNVNFGDPHIEAYCIVLRDGELYTDHQDKTIPCQRDDRGPPATIVSS